MSASSPIRAAVPAALLLALAVPAQAFRVPPPDAPPLVLGDGPPRSWSAPPVPTVAARERVVVPHGTEGASRAGRWRRVVPVAAGLGVLFATDDRTLDVLAGRSGGDSAKAWRAVSDAGEAGFTVGLPLATWALGSLADRPRMAETGRLMTRALFMSTAEVAALKGLVGRERPFPDKLDEDDTGSFPSGHATSAFAVATVLSGRTERRWVRWTSFAAAGLIGTARVAGEKHYASDVAAGAVLGYATGRLVLREHRREAERLRILELMRAAP